MDFFSFSLKLNLFESEKYVVEIKLLREGIKKFKHFEYKFKFDITQVPRALYG